MWYVPGNRDGEAIDEPNRFIIDRLRPRQHLSFGFGIAASATGWRKCNSASSGKKILKLWPDRPIEVVGEPKRVFSNFIKGYEALPVRIPG